MPRQTSALRLNRFAGHGDGDDLLECAGFLDEAGDGVGTDDDDVVFFAFLVGVFEAGDGHAGVVADAALAEERKLEGGDEDVFGGFLGVEIAGAGEVEFFGEDVLLGGIGDGTEAVEDGDGREGGEGFAGFAKAQFGAGDPLLEGVFIHAHKGERYGA